MQLKDCPVPIYGDTTFRGKCPKEELEQVTFFNRLRREYPDTYGAIAIHPRNEQQLKGGHHRQLASQKASLLGVSSRVALLSEPDAMAMAASQALLFGSHASGLGDYCPAVGVSAASESVHGPIILCAGNAPLALHGHEISLANPPSIANSLEKAFHDRGYRERLKQSAQRVANAGWDWESHATAYDSFVSNAFG